MNHVGYCLCLREVQFAVYESSAGELPWFCKAYSGGKQRGQDLLDHEVTAVATNLHNVVSRVAGWRAEDGDGYLIDPKFTRHPPTMMDGMSLGLCTSRMPIEQQVATLECTWTTHT
jgi:hypothetical protein